jgi:prepilin-type processing-associated H-X9-DG protein
MPVLYMGEPAWGQAGGISKSAMPTQPELTPYKASKVQHSSDICLIWDGEQMFDPATSAKNASGFYNSYGNALPVSVNIDGGNGFFSAVLGNGVQSNFLFSTSPSGGTPTDLNAAISTDGAPTQGSNNSANAAEPCDMQWRHGTSSRNASANFLFLDGHAETRLLNLGKGCDIKHLNVCVNSNQ